jgi:hypothetical protein
MTGAGNVMKGLLETHGNRQGSPNGNQVTTERQTGGMETIGTQGGLVEKGGRRRIH